MPTRNQLGLVRSGLEPVNTDLDPTEKHNKDEQINIILVSVSKRLSHEGVYYCQDTLRGIYNKTRL